MVQKRLIALVLVMMSCSLNLILIISCGTAHHSLTIEKHIVAQESVLWSFDTGEDVTAQPLIADIDEDGQPEVITCNHAGNIIVLEPSDGSVKWSCQTGIKLWSAPGLGDLDGDGILELVYSGTQFTDPRHSSNKTMALNCEDQSPLWWIDDPQIGSDNKIIVADLNNDGNSDVLYPYHNTLSAINGQNGSLLFTLESCPCYYDSTPSIGDIDSDGELEILAGWEEGGFAAFEGSSGDLIWSFETEELWGWSSPYHLELGDVDKDGSLDVFGGAKDNFYLLNSEDGTLKWSVSISNPLSSAPSFGDLDGDNQEEIVFGLNYGETYALNGEDGSQLWMSKKGGRSSMPVLHDIDADDKLEVFIGDQTDFALYGLDGEDGWLVYVFSAGGAVSSPTLYDIDNDGQVEAIIGSRDGMVYALNLASAGRTAGYAVSIIRFLPLILLFGIAGIFAVVRFWFGRQDMIEVETHWMKLEHRFIQWLQNLRINEFRASVMFWILTLFSPSLIHSLDIRQSQFYVFAPLWSVQLDYAGDSSIQYVFLIYHNYIQNWNIISGIGQLFAVIQFSIPLIFTAIVIESFSRGVGRTGFTRYSVALYPVIILLFEIIFWTSGSTFLFLPMPLASVIHYLRYKQISLQKEDRVSEEMITPIELPQMIDVLRGGEFVANRLKYKVKIVNTTSHVVTDVVVSIGSYPRESLKIDGEITKTIPKLEPSGFRTPTFDFLPTQDCVKGDVIATVSFVDYNGKAHSTTAEPFTIRAVCDLLRPESISPEDFMLKLATLGYGEMATRVEDWTPEEMRSKTLQILQDSNFFNVTSESTPVADHVESKITGWARGMYTGKSLGVQITITGKAGFSGATCKVRMSGEDEAMIMPAIDEITQKLSAWLCPMCGGKLPANLVDKLKEGESIACPFCGVTMNR